MNDIVRPPEDPGTGSSGTSALEAMISNAAHEKSVAAVKAPVVSTPATPVQPSPAPPAPPVVPAAAAATIAAVVPAAAAAAHAEDSAEEEEEKRKADRDKRLAAAIQRRKSSKTKPLLFVLWTLGAWWMLSVLADIVITCVPGGAPCRAPYVFERVFGRLSIFSSTNPPPVAGMPALSGLTKYEWPLLLLALLAALWVAKGKVYPETDDTGEFTEAELNGKRE